MLASANSELVFELIRDEWGHFSARCLTAKIAVAGDDLAELHDNVAAAVAARFPDGGAPEPEAIHFVMFP